MFLFRSVSIDLCPILTVLGLCQCQQMLISRLEATTALDVSILVFTRNIGLLRGRHITTKSSQLGGATRRQQSCDIGSPEGLPRVVAGDPIFIVLVLHFAKRPRLP
jgi:hypothetical protein